MAWTGDVASASNDEVADDVASASNLGLLRSQEPKDWVTGGMWGV